MYVLWMWFATMYLTHHYMIDLVGGSIYAILAYAVAQKFLPKTNSETRTRLGYLGITKSGFRSYIYSIEHDTHEYNAVTSGDEESAMKEIVHEAVVSSYHRHVTNRPEPLRLEMTNKGIEEPALSPTLSVPSSGYWSPTSEPQSPITPHSPSLHHFAFSKTS